MSARIYRPAKSAMSSGQAKTRSWVLEFSHDTARRVDPLMGWTGSADMNRQVQLKFDSKEDAITYASKMGLDFEVKSEHKRKRNIQSYADNFK